MPNEDAKDAEDELEEANVHTHIWVPYPMWLILVSALPRELQPELQPPPEAFDGPDVVVPRSIWLLVRYILDRCSFEQH